MASVAILKLYHHSSVTASKYAKDFSCDSSELNCTTSIPVNRLNPNESELKEIRDYRNIFGESLKILKESATILEDSLKIIGETERSGNFYTGFTECLHCSRGRTLTLVSINITNT